MDLEGDGGAAAVAGRRLDVDVVGQAAQRDRPPVAECRPGGEDLARFAQAVLVAGYPARVAPDQVGGQLAPAHARAGRR